MQAKVNQPELPEVPQPDRVTHPNAPDEIPLEPGPQDIPRREQGVIGFNK